MWNWRPKHEQPVASRNTYIQDFLQSSPRSLDHPSVYYTFDLKKEYTYIKENHPYRQQVEQPHQKPIRATYLEQLPQLQPFQIVTNSYLKPDLI
jgi:hypothetical protein